MLRGLRKRGQSPTAESVQLVVRILRSKPIRERHEHPAFTEAVMVEIRLKVFDVEA